MGGRLPDRLDAAPARRAAAAGGRRLAVKAGYPPEDRLEEADVAAAKWAFENNRPAGRGADTLPGGRAPLPADEDGARRRRGHRRRRRCRGPLLSPERRRLFDALSDQAALAIERVHLVEDLDRSKRNAETDRLSTALLTSISHDLRTPLAAILGADGNAAGTFSAQLAEAREAELVATIDEEAERLNRFIANLLDMTRLESGAIRPRLAAQDLADLVGAALKRAATILAGHRVTTRLAADLPMVELDAVLFEQALFNLLDNAAKYSEAGGTITIAAARDAGTVVITVVDDGPGIPDGHAETHFR